MPGPEIPSEQPPQSVVEALGAFRSTMETVNAQYRVTVRYFDPRAERTITVDAALWGDVEDAR